MTDKAKDLGAPGGAFTPGPWEQTRRGNLAFEIQGGGHSIAIVGRVQASRLHYLNTVRSKAAKLGEQAHQAEREATQIEQTDLLPDARLIATAPEMYAALHRAEGALRAACTEFVSDTPAPVSGFVYEAIDAVAAVLAKAEGRSAAQPPSKDLP